jgi:transposase
MNELSTEHYRALLGLDANWKVTSVEFLPKQKAVDFHINFCGSGLKCPQCKCDCTQADLAPQRSWRHLDTMQFTTTIHASLPRSKCEAWENKRCQESRSVRNRFLGSDTVPDERDGGRDRLPFVQRQSAQSHSHPVHFKSRLESEFGHRGEGIWSPRIVASPICFSIDHF